MNENATKIYYAKKGNKVNIDLFPKKRLDKKFVIKRLKFVIKNFNP